MVDKEDHTNKFTQKNEEMATQQEAARPTFENGQLSYIGFDVDSIPRVLIEDYCNITSRLDLSFNRLISVRGLEHFKFLKELVLDNNDIGDDVEFPNLKDLHTLTLNKNKLTDLNSLLDKLVERFPSLTYLSLLGNQACPNQLSSSDKDEEDYQRYRYFVIYKLPALKFLDSTQVTAAEAAEAKRIGPYMLVVRPSDNDLEESSSSNSSRTQYTPLPAEAAIEDMDHQGTFGKSKYIYYGRHSEGNRFIRNRDL